MQDVTCTPARSNCSPSFNPCPAHEQRGWERHVALWLMFQYATDDGGARDRLDAAIAIARRAGKRATLDHYAAIRDALTAGAEIERASA